MNNLKREAEKIIEELRRTHKRSRKHGRGKYGFVRYLKQVYDQFAAWRETPGMATKMRDQITKSAKVPKVTQKKHSFNVIITATATEETRAKSRWAQALQYAWRWRRLRQQHRMTLREFFQKNGGVAGCARNFSQGIRPNL